MSVDLILSPSFGKTMKAPEVWFRWNRKNAYSIASLLPLVNAGLTTEPLPGIMLYSFATAQAEEVYREVAAAAKADAIFIAGGPHPSARPEDVLQYFDYVVLGEGEETLPRLLDALVHGQDPETVNGIAFRRGEEVIITRPREPVDLDCYPPFKNILAPLEISRGCPWGCAYCQTPRLFGCRMRHRSVPVITKFARRLKDIRTTSPNSLAYGSDGRVPRLDKVEALLKSLSSLRRPIYFGTFPSEVRPEFVSEDSLQLITRYCANKTLSIGGQSGSERVLKAIGRGHGVEEVLLACELCRFHGIGPLVDLIFGLPMESPEDQHLTMDLALEIVGMGGRVRAHGFTPLPGTPLEHCLPSALAPEVEAELGRLALGGQLTGSWSLQR
jgi:B12-binding domain/radical SAM domain protein